MSSVYKVSLYITMKEKMSKPKIITVQSKNWLKQHSVPKDGAL